MILTSLAMCLTLKKGIYRHWVALTPQFYHNDAIYYEVTNFSAAALALSLIEKAPDEPNYDYILTQVRQAQNEILVTKLTEDREMKKRSTNLCGVAKENWVMAYIY